MWGALRRPHRFLFSLWPLRSIAYLLTSVVLGAVALPLTVLLLLFAPVWGILLGWVERRRVRLTGLSRIPPAHLPLTHRDWQVWVRVRLNEPTTWREVGYLLAAIGFAILGAALIFGGLVAIGILPAGMWIEFHREAPVFTLFGGPWALPEPLTVLLVGLTASLAVAAFSYVAGLFAALQSTVANALLAPRHDEVERQIARLTVSRMTLLEAFESERRRIERNLHDGVQQQLVSLTMALAIAELDLKEAANAGHPVASARDSVAAAHRQAEDALIELRNTVRGIHPHALSTHGLAEAIKELAGRTPIPVEEDIDLPERLPATIESSLYFIVSETLTNAVKHSGANRINVMVRADDRDARLSIRDNGRGGIDPAQGTGIRGLRERVEAHRGTFELTSPTGGPTTLTVTIPLPKRHGDAEHANPGKKREEQS